MNAVAETVIQKNVKDNPLYSKYFKADDRESAYEILTKEAKEAQEQAEKEAKEAEKEAEKKAREKEKAAKKKSSSSRKKKSAFDKVLSSAANTVGREVGKKLVRGILGSLKW